MLFFLPKIFSLLVMASMAEYGHARNIFLNGEDVSSAKNQLLENVTLQIDGEGNIYIEAPHYQALEESTFVPLSQFATKHLTPVNSATPPTRGDNPKKNEPSQPASAGKTRKLQDKPGSKSGP